MIGARRAQKVQQDDASFILISGAIPPFVPIVRPLLDIQLPTRTTTETEIQILHEIIEIGFSDFLWF